MQTAATKYSAYNNQTDSLFGMALTQAFTGFAFGANVEMAFEGAEQASNIRNDRMKPANANKAATGFEWGATGRLSNAFGTAGQDAPKTQGELDHQRFAPAAPVFAP